MNNWTINTNNTLTMSDVNNSKSQSPNNPREKEFKTSERKIVTGKHWRKGSGSITLSQKNDQQRPNNRYCSSQDDQDVVEDEIQIEEISPLVKTPTKSTLNKNNDGVDNSAHFTEISQNIKDLYANIAMLDNKLKTLEKVDSNYNVFK